MFFAFFSERADCSCPRHVCKKFQANIRRSEYVRPTWSYISAKVDSILKLSNYCVTTQISPLRSKCSTTFWRDNRYMISDPLPRCWRTEFVFFIFLWKFCISQDPNSPKKRKKKAGEKNKKKMGALGTCVPNFRVCLEPGVNIGRWTNLGQHAWTSLYTKLYVHLGFIPFTRTSLFSHYNSSLCAYIKQCHRTGSNNSNNSEVD